MKKLILIIVAFMLGIGSVYAAGGKNNGTTGQGQTSTGSDAQGQATQGRAGR